jgi:predicted TIM-barrel fold metal-dependent hydrolase
MAPLWKIAADEGGSVIIDPGPPFNRGYQIDAIEQLAKQYPSVPIIVEHLAYLTEKTSKSPRHLAEWRRMWRLAHHKNVYLGLSAAGSLLEDVYPCQTMRRRMREVYKEIGPQKLLWGTDAPVTLNMYTYTQMQDMHRTEMDFLSTDDRKLIMGGNALRLWWAKQS